MFFQLGGGFVSGLLDVIKGLFSDIRAVVIVVIGLFVGFFVVEELIEFIREASSIRFYTGPAITKREAKVLSKVLTPAQMGRLEVALEEKKRVALLKRFGLTEREAEKVFKEPEEKK